MSALFLRLKRTKFTNTLGRYWDLFLPTWNVLLHGNPVRDIFGGIKVAASGELGIGVGEEDRGSGEREVLEGLVGRIDGLVDLVVSKFGDSDPDDFDKAGEDKKNPRQHPHTSWLGIGKEPGAEDGAVFLGMGTLSKKSIRDITHWMEDMYTWGENAYGVLESPKAARRTRAADRNAQPRRKSTPPNTHIPPSLFAPKQDTKSAGDTPPRKQDSPPPERRTTGDPEEETAGIEKYMDYLKLGYGKYWTLGGESITKDSESSGANNTEDIQAEPERPGSSSDDMNGHFLIGHTGAIQDDWVEDPEDRRFAMEYDDMNSRTMVRTLTVELETDLLAESEESFSLNLGSHDTDLSSGVWNLPFAFDSQDRNKTQRLRVVVYVARPFMFTFLFAVRTESLALQGLYRSLHHQIAPLRKLLAKSTTYRPDRPDMGKTTAGIYDLVWDPRARTVHSTIPNIPDPAEIYNSYDEPAWSRVEALNTHMQILSLWKATRAEISGRERTAKTSRGWWVVWSRIIESRLDDSSSSSTERGRSASREESSTVSTVSMTSTASSTIQDLRDTDTVSKEIFLIRKASDHAGHGRSVSLTGATAGGWTGGASRLAQGIGVDTKKYIEGLLSLNR